MTIAFDAYTSIASTGTGNISGTHTPVGTPRGVFVAICIAEGGASKPDIVEVLYGGVPMENVACTHNIFAESVGVHLFFLGKGIPTGAQTVAVNRYGQTGADNLIVDCITVTAGADTYPIRSIGGCAAGESGNLYTSLTPSVGTPSANFYSVSACSTGFGAAPSISSPTGWTAVRATDHGSYGSAVARDDSERSTGDGTITWTMGSDEATAAICTIVEGTDPNDVICIGKLFDGAVNGGPAVIDLTKMTSLAENDVIVVGTASDVTSTAVNVVTSGYAQIGSTVAPAVDCNLACFWKAMGGTVDTAITSATHGANDGVCLAAYVFRGASPTNPIDTSASASAVAAASADNPSVTPSAADSTVVCIFAEDGIQNNWPYISGSLGIVSDTEYDSANDVNDMMMGGGVHYQQGGPSAFNPGAWTTDVAVSAWAAMSIVLQSPPPYVPDFVNDAIMVSVSS